MRHGKQVERLKRVERRAALSLDRKYHKAEVVGLLDPALKPLLQSYKDRLETLKQIHIRKINLIRFEQDWSVVCTGVI